MGLPGLYRKNNITIEFMLPDFNLLTQIDDWDCWLTCAEMAVNYEGLQPVLNREIFRESYSGKRVNKRGYNRRAGRAVLPNDMNSLEGIAQIITGDFSINETSIEWVPNMQSEEVFNKIDRYLRDNKPILIGITLADGKGGHAILIVGYKKRPIGITYIVADPSRKSNGGIRSLTENVDQILFY